MRASIRLTRTIGIALLLLSGAVPVCAGPFEDGQAAAAAGDYAKALELWRPLAKHGDVAAQDSLGVMYATGRGVSQSYREAAKWFLKAAKQGDAMAQTQLGAMYCEGQGVDWDNTEAVKWLSLAVAQEYAEAQEILGCMYARGSSSPGGYISQDFPAALTLLRLAAGQGRPGAQFELGRMCELGSGVPKDYAEAVRWYRQAATGGFAEAQYKLALFLESGRGTSVDKVEAIVWCRKAVEQGFETTELERPQPRYLLERLEVEVDWAAASSAGTLTAYDDFILRHPGAVQISEAREERTWLAALQENSEEALQTYVWSYPAGRHLAEANDRLGSVAWDTAARLNTDDGWIAFVARHPTDPRVADALNKLTDHVVIRDGGVIPWAAFGGKTWTQPRDDGFSNWSGTLISGVTVMALEDVTYICDENSGFVLSNWVKLNQVICTGELWACAEGFRLKSGTAIVPAGLLK